MGKGEIWNFSTSLQLDVFQVRATIFHILQVMQRRKIVKAINMGKKLKMRRSKTKRNKLGPCMNVFIDFNPYTTLDLFHPKQMIIDRFRILWFEC